MCQSVKITIRREASRHCLKEGVNVNIFSTRYPNLSSSFILVRISRVDAEMKLITLPIKSQASNYYEMNTCRKLPFLDVINTVVFIKNTTI